MLSKEVKIVCSDHRFLWLDLNCSKFWIEEGIDFYGALDYRLYVILEGRRF